MNELDLSETHKELMRDFLKFCRYKRTQCLKDVEGAFSDVVESRLFEETFTSDEVKEILDGLCSVLKADVGSDLMHSSHTSALLLRQLFQQAERYHLKMKANLSELESRDLLDKIADFERKELSVSSMNIQRHRQLDPIDTSGPEKLLHMEIERLKDENSKLQSRVHSVEDKAISALSAKEHLQESMQAQQSYIAPAADPEVPKLQLKISEMQLELNEAKSKVQKSQSTLQLELEETSHNLLKVTAELEQKERELQKKFSETTQYINMRKMMESKTATIQTLRAKLKDLER